MEYSTAKKLKDAGFPQETTGPFIDKDGDEWGPRPSIEHAYLPTLSELIEACGDDFHALIQQHWPEGTVVWEATSKSNKSLIGPTPSEAVANLWLALQEKK